MCVRGRCAGGRIGVVQSRRMFPLRWIRALSTGVAAACLIAVAVAGAEPEEDRLAAEISRWSSLVAGETGTDPLLQDAKGAGEALLTQAREALQSGRRLVALERLAAVVQTFGSVQYVMSRPAAERQELPAFEAEWKRAGGALRDVIDPDGRAAAAAGSIRPALARALAEISVVQARESYHASLEYGRNTEPQYGLYYLGAAHAQRGFVDILHALPAPPPSSAPPLRSLRPDIDALQSRLLAAYRPPASIERHGEFIVASAALKEAREQDAAGHRHAALLRYLQAAQRTAMITQTAPADAAAVGSNLEEFRARLQGDADHSIARFFVERAEAALAAPGEEAAAAAIASEVLPRYFAALAPAPAPAPAAAATVTVTLVRWPFT